ncbi:hypothetical protein PINS_up002176 [Pythium insidiosum]|nr:hypothetical protein PINS_up002176 [Pythium insidiosum]
MPASKKRIQRGGGAAVAGQQVPAALRDWVHIWHGVRVRQDGSSATPTTRLQVESSCGDSDDAYHGGSRLPPPATSIFHSGSRLEALTFWQSFVRLPANSLFPRVHSTSNPRRRYKDFLYVLLNMRWPALGTVLLLVFLVNIVVFALLVYGACRDPDTLLKSFNLSYQTFSTIGFGIVYPTTTCSNLVMVVESFASMLVTSAITGLVFAKFAKPRAKVAFSNVCAIQPYGKRYLALVMRVANATQSKDVTHDVIMEANFKVHLLRIEQKQSDKQWAQAESTTSDVLCSYNLKLLQHNFITFRMGLAVVHIINEESPLFGMSETDLASSDMIIEIAMSGVDSTLQDTVSERYTYTAEDIRWGFRFAEMLDFDEFNSDVIMDFAKLSAIEPTPIDCARYVRSSDVPNDWKGDKSSRKQSTDTDVTRRSSLGDDQSSFLVHKVGGSAGNQCVVDNGGHGNSSEGDYQDDRSHDEAFGYRESIDGDDDYAPTYHKKAAPNKFCLGLEPLFEPLLQPSVGTQRLHRDHSDGLARRNGRLVSMAAPQPLQHSAAQLVGSGLIDEGVDEQPSEFILPVQQRRQLQGQLMGEVDTDDEDTSLDTAPSPVPSVAPQYKISNTRQANQSVVSVDVQDTPRFMRVSPMNIPKSYDFMRLYNSALYVRWPKIIMVFVISFIVINLIFALIYWAEMSEIASYPDINVSNFELAFFMSVHTIATIGYGSISPTPTAVYMNLWVLVESSLGIIAVTIITGIAWAKFARPRAHIHFSANIAVTSIYGHRCLMFRAGNTRHSGDVHENFFRIGVILTNRKTGLRQIYDVPLVRAEWPSIKLPATLIHVIDESSPFYKFRSLDQLSESRVAVIALLTGLDTTFSENVYARKMYFWDDFAFGARFDDFAVLRRDCIEVDFNRFDALVPEDEDPTWQPCST